MAHKWNLKKILPDHRHNKNSLSNQIKNFNSASLKEKIIFFVLNSVSYLFKNAVAFLIFLAIKKNVTISNPIIVTLFHSYFSHEWELI